MAHVLRHSAYASQPLLASAGGAPAIKSHKRHAPSLSAVQLEASPDRAGASVDSDQPGAVDDAWAAESSVPETRTLVTSLDALVGYVNSLRQQELLPEADLLFLERCVSLDQAHNHSDYIHDDHSDGDHDPPHQPGSTAVKSSSSSSSAALLELQHKMSSVLESAFSLYQQEEVRLTALGRLLRQEREALQLPLDDQSGSGSDDDDDTQGIAQARSANQSELFDTVRRIAASWRKASPYAWLLQFLVDMHTRAHVITFDERAQLELLVLDNSPTVTRPAAAAVLRMQECYPELYREVLAHLQCPAFSNHQPQRADHHDQSWRRHAHPAARIASDLIEALQTVLERRYRDSCGTEYNWAASYVQRLRRPPPTSGGDADEASNYANIFIAASYPGPALPLPRAELTHLKAQLACGHPVVMAAFANYGAAMEAVASQMMDQSNQEVDDTGME